MSMLVDKELVNDDIDTDGVCVEVAVLFGFFNTFLKES